MLDKDQNEIDLKQSFEDDDDMGLTPVDASFDEEYVNDSEGADGYGIDEGADDFSDYFGDEDDADFEEEEIDFDSLAEE